YKVVRISRSQRKVVHFLEADGPADVYLRRIDHGCAATHINNGADRAHNQIGIDSYVGSGVEQDPGSSLCLESLLLDGDGVCPQRQVGKHVITIFVRGLRTLEAGVVILAGYLRIRDRRVGGVGDPAANTAIDGLRLGQARRHGQIEHTPRREKHPTESANEHDSRLAIEIGARALLSAYHLSQEEVKEEAKIGCNAAARVIGK